ncbi:hypothetical protein ABBQ32_010558 [Trebouxia sp. C0010 RCD-2024]
MTDGFAYMFSILVAIFCLIFVILLVVKICDRRQHLQPAQAGASSIEVVVHVHVKHPPSLHTAPIYEAVCISNPDGKTVYAAPSIPAEGCLQRADTAFVQPLPQERPWHMPVSPN